MVKKKKNTREYEQTILASSLIDFALVLSDLGETCIQLFGLTSWGIVGEQLST